MIVDRIENLEQYAHCIPAFSQVRDFLLRACRTELEEGRYDLGTDAAYGLIRRYRTQLPEQQRLEAHRDYIDLQLLLEGEETLLWQNIGALTPETDYGAQTDCRLYSGGGMRVPLRKGVFVVLYPQDGHLPKLADGQSTEVRKAVVKIRVEGRPQA